AAYAMTSTPDTLGLVQGIATDAATQKVLPNAKVTIGSNSVNTDSKGAFTLAAAAGTQPISITANGYVAWSDTVHVSAGAPSSLSPKLSVDRAVLSGTITDAKSHAPVEGAKISVGTLSATSNASGAYSLAVPSGNQTVTVTSSVFNTATSTVHITAGVNASKSFALTRPLATVTGKVTDSTTHQGVAGVKVSIGSTTTTTNSTGSFTLSVVGGGTQSIIATANSYT